MSEPASAPVPADETETIAPDQVSEAPEFRHVPNAVSAAHRYRIVRSHAQGGLGEVFLAADEEVRREVALKQIQGAYADLPESRARFLREAEITGGLEHPGVVPVYGLGSYADGRPFYAMRFIRGESLKDAIDSFHRQDPRGRSAGAQVLELRQLLGRFIAVCNTIAYAHGRGVLHRDLKPANIMLGSYGETLVVDWGLAKQFERTDAERASGETTLPPASGSGPEGATQAGRAMGTPAFMSPEQAAGRWEVLGPATDIYGLGAILYNLLTGVPPYQDPLPEMILVQVIQGQARRPRQVKRSVPRALEAICLKAMAPNPKDRYESARALADDVEQWLADEPVHAYRESSWERTKRLCRRRPAYAAAMGFVLAVDAVALVLALAASIWSGSNLAALPFMIVGALIGVTIVVFFAAQLWWVFGALVGTVLTCRGSWIGGVIGLIVAGLSAAPQSLLNADPSLGHHDLVWSLSNRYLVFMAPVLGLVVGVLVTALLSVFWAWTRRRLALSWLIGGMLGMIVGHIALWASGLLVTHERLAWEAPAGTMIAGALAGAALGIVIVSSRVYGKRAALWALLGVFIGVAVAAAALVYATAGYIGLSSFALGAASLGGLAGAALGTLIAASGEARKRAARSAGTGGKLAVTVGTVAVTVAACVSMQLALGGNAFLMWLALAAALAPLFIELGLGLLSKAGRQSLLTRALRGSVIGSVLGLSIELGLVFGEGQKRVQEAAARGAANAPAPAPDRVKAPANFPGANLKLDPDDPWRAWIAMQEDLVRKNPNAAEHVIALAGAYNGQGNTARGKGALDKALLSYDKAVATLEAVLKKEPRNAKAREVLKNSYAIRAETLARLGRHPEALTAWSKALEVDAWPDRNEYRLQRALMLARLGEHAKAADEADLLAAGKDLPEATLFTLACIYARAAGTKASAPQGPSSQLADRYAKSALKHLADAEAVGYFAVASNRDKLNREADLDPIRLRAEFTELATRLGP
jgi:tetratricopeptide (TPR) repeat protein